MAAAAAPAQCRWWLHPAPGPAPPLAVGEHAFVIAKRRCRCEVLDASVDALGQRVHGQARLRELGVGQRGRRQDAGSKGGKTGHLTFHLPPEKLYRWRFPNPLVASPAPTPSPSHRTEVVLCRDTTEMRRLARAVAQPSDFAIDIGCSYGHCTTVLSQHCGRVLGVDIGTETIARARKGFPALAFEVLNVVTEQPRLVALAAGCTLCFVDIGGDRAGSTVLDIIRVVRRRLAPRLVVVKSEELVDAATAAGAVTDSGLLERLPFDEMVAAHPQPTPAQGQPGEAAGGEEGWRPRKRRRLLHPLRYPLARASADAPPICRYHNYGTCHKLASGRCDLDHEHCHQCLQAGHAARDCPQLSLVPRTSSLVAAPAAVAVVANGGGNG